MLTHAWLNAGTRLLNHFQRIKAEQRMLDFADLEWKAYRLLNHGDHAEWVQYKLDQRIEHILVDEFQDTNPTQWHLLYPLLQELAAGGQERARSVFLVGDTKQSIYRFRRADPNLFPAAQYWLAEQLRADTHGLAASWRSAPAVIDFVNQVLKAVRWAPRWPSFPPRHSSHGIVGACRDLALGHPRGRNPARSGDGTTQSSATTARDSSRPAPSSRRQCDRRAHSRSDKRLRRRG